MPIPTLIIAGTHSGSGKTTITLAVMAALVRRGLVVQGFKVGPDFIDPGHQSAITGRPSRNLDTWLLDGEALGDTFHRGIRGADVAVIEGVMGLFDGRGALDESGSTADLARRLALPVVLVVDAKGMARSIAPMVRGFSDFDPGVQVSGVIANRVGSRRHFDRYLTPALEQSCPDVEPLGYLARTEGLSIPSRHLGLMTSDEFPGDHGFLEHLADAAESSIDLDRLLGLARVPKLPGPRLETTTPSKIARVAWARDPAFCFYYEDNLDLLRSAGGEVVRFSPMTDRDLPEGTDVLYLGGGYPEVFAERLAANDAMRRAIRRFHDDGGTILAECGGLMACSRELVDVSGRSFPMWGLIPARVVMRPRFAALGYVTVVVDEPGPFGPAGTTLRGHEFHYSTLEPLAKLDHATHLLGPEGVPKPDGIRVGGLLAGYAHVHLGSNPASARHLLGRQSRKPIPSGPP